MADIVRYDAAMWWLALAPALACSEIAGEWTAWPDEGAWGDVPQVPRGARIALSGDEPDEIRLVGPDGSEWIRDVGGGDAGWALAHVPSDLEPGTYEWWGADSWRRRLEIVDALVPDPPAVEHVGTDGTTERRTTDACDTSAEPMAVVTSRWDVPIAPSAGWMLEVQRQDGSVVDLTPWEAGGGELSVDDVVEAEAIWPICHRLVLRDPRHSSVLVVEGECVEAPAGGCGCASAGSPGWAVILAAAMIGRRRWSSKGASSR
jgi:hypothetical protein